MSRRATFTMARTPGLGSRWRHRVGSAVMATFLATGTTLVGALPATADETIRITDRVTPANLEIPAGTAVVWANDDADRHRVRSRTGPEQFDSGNIDPGEQFSFVFGVEGTYTYVDERNPTNTAYHGTITVTAAGGGGGTGGGTGGTVVRMIDRAFSPTSLTVAPGTTVTFPNQDTEDHTVTARDGSFDSGIYGPGQTYSRTFDTPGVFSYFCALHPDMVGTITVTQADGSAPSPTPTTTTVPPPPPGPGAVQAFDFGYTPATLTVAVGQTVTFTNAGVALHTFTDRAGRFDSGLISAGGSWSRRFDTAGTYQYFCTLHPDMAGTLVVQSATGTAPPPPAPTPTTTPTSSGGSTAVARAGSVSMVDNAFSPSNLTVRVGSTVTWVNDGAAIHTATDANGGFDSGLINPGGRFSHRFDRAGTYRYTCIVHPGMAGTITVVDASGTAPPPAQTTPTTAPPDASGPPAVSIVGGALNPEVIEAPLGSSIVWTNDGDSAAQLVSADGSFASPAIQPGETWTFQPEAIGEIEYRNVLAADAVTGRLLVVPAPAVQAAGAASVSIIDLDYTPRDLSVTVGTEVTWTNTGQAPHTVTARDQSFDSGILQSGDTWSMTFDTEGVYEYICTLHPDMTGTVRVLAADASATDLMAASSGSERVLPPELGVDDPPQPAGSMARTAIQVIAVIAFAGTTVGLFRVGRLVLGGERAT